MSWQFKRERKKTKHRNKKQRQCIEMSKSKRIHCSILTVFCVVVVLLFISFGIYTSKLLFGVIWVTSSSSRPCILYSFSCVVCTLFRWFVSTHDIQGNIILIISQNTVASQNHLIWSSKTYYTKNIDFSTDVFIEHLTVNRRRRSRNSNIENKWENEERKKNTHSQSAIQCE